MRKIIAMTKFKEPLVTIYIPTFNRINLLKRALDSVLAQTYKNIEVIVVDDCSSDETANYLQEISLQDKRIRYHIKEKNGGACESRNIAINMAKGDFITGLDDDDYFKENRIKEFVEHCRKTGHDFLCSSFIIKDKKEFRKSNPYEGLIDSYEIKYKNLIDNQVFTRLDFMKKVGGFDENAPAWQDYDLWFRLVINIKPCFRINNYSYVKDISHENPRITTSSKAYKGYLYFVAKHKHILSQNNKKCLYMIDILNRNQKIPFLGLVNHFCLKSLIIYIKHLTPKSLVKLIRE